MRRDRPAGSRDRRWIRMNRASSRNRASDSSGASITYAFRPSAESAAARWSDVQASPLTRAFPKRLSCPHFLAPDDRARRNLRFRRAPHIDRSAFRARRIHPPGQSACGFTSVGAWPPEHAGHQMASRRRPSAGPRLEVHELPDRHASRPSFPAQHAARPASTSCAPSPPSFRHWPPARCLRRSHCRFTTADVPTGTPASGKQPSAAVVARNSVSRDTGDSGLRQLRRTVRRRRPRSGSHWHRSIAPSSNLDELRRWRGLELPRQMQPARWDVRDVLPRIACGKHDLLALAASR